MSNLVFNKLVIPVIYITNVIPVSFSTLSEGTLF